MNTSSIQSSIHPSIHHIFNSSYLHTELLNSQSLTLNSQLSTHKLCSFFLRLSGNFDLFPFSLIPSIVSHHRERDFSVLQVRRLPELSEEPRFSTNILISLFFSSLLPFLKTLLSKQTQGSGSRAFSNFVVIPPRAILCTE